MYLTRTRCSTGLDHVQLVSPDTRILGDPIRLDLLLLSQLFDQKAQVQMSQGKRTRVKKRPLALML